MRAVDVSGTNVDDIPRPLMALGLDVSDSQHDLPEHHHVKCELIYTAKGLLTCEVDGHLWLIPPQCALWIPSMAPHRSQAFGRIECYAMFVEPLPDSRLPTSCCAVTVSPLLREILLRVVEFPPLYPIDGPEARLLPVVLDELSSARLEVLRLLLPSDPGLRRLTNLIMANPADRATLGEWAVRAGLSERTMRRRFSDELGMSLGRWRRQLHVTLAMQRMAGGDSVQAIALDLGYEGASSFITMFKKTVGQPPGRYFAERQDFG